MNKKSGTSKASATKLVNQWASANSRFRPIRLSFDGASSQCIYRISDIRKQHHISPSHEERQ